MGELAELVSIWEKNNSDWSAASRALTLIRKQGVEVPELVLTMGALLLSKYRSKLGHETWFVYEDVLKASIVCHSTEWANYTFKKLKDQFGDTPPVMRLEGMLKEYTGRY
jgi:hypothetical protein